MKEQKSRRGLVVVALLLLVAIVSVGYALLTSNLSIVGTTSTSAETWDVHFENIANAAANNADVTVTTPAYIYEASSGQTPSDETDDLTVKFNVSFKKPGDKYEFDVDVVNDGSLYAKCTDIEVTIPTANDYDDFLEITYSGLAENDVLAPSGQTGSSKTMHVVAKFKDVNNLPATALSGDMSIAIEFTQDNTPSN